MPIGADTAIGLITYQATTAPRTIPTHKLHLTQPHSYSLSECRELPTGEFAGMEAWGKPHMLWSPRRYYEGNVSKLHANRPKSLRASTLQPARIVHMQGLCQDTCRRNPRAMQESCQVGFPHTLPPMQGACQRKWLSLQHLCADLKLWEFGHRAAAYGVGKSLQCGNLATWGPTPDPPGGTTHPRPPGPGRPPAGGPTL